MTQHVGERLANAAMAIVYKKPINWRSPTYMSAKAGTTLGEVTVSLNDVLAAGLTLKPREFDTACPPSSCFVGPRDDDLTRA